MTKTVQLTDLFIRQLNLDYEKECVIAIYDLKDDNGQIWESGTAYFWVTIPPTPMDEPVPNNWFQLPSSYFPTLLQLQTDADTALTAQFLV